MPSACESPFESGRFLESAHGAISPSSDQALENPIFADFRQAKLVSFRIIVPQGTAMRAESIATF
jgi:hypothetical protein